MDPLATAQTSPSSASTPSAANVSAIVQQTTQSVQQIMQQLPGGVAPLQPGQTLGGGNVSGSSSRPKSGNETDSFDLAPKGGGGGTVRGNASGPIFSEDLGNAEAESLPSLHVVQKRDTLWDIADQYFQNAYEWPRIWSYNPQVVNPHWIEVGDKIRLRAEATLTLSDRPTARGGAATDFRLQKSRVIPKTVFLREEGFVSNQVVDTAGEVSGAREDKLFLSTTDEIYVRILTDGDVRLGDELSVFRVLRKVGSKGRLVHIQGTVRVDDWDPRTHVARATVMETMDTIERGARVAYLPKRYEVVPPSPNASEGTGQILATVPLLSVVGQNQIVYVDRGTDHGLVPGNRLQVIRRGDSWRRSLPTPAAARRIATESEDAARIEVVAPPRNEKQFPEEIVAELRVVDVQKDTSMCLIVESRREVEVGESIIYRKGY
jgi:LysM repeat protein